MKTMRLCTLLLCTGILFPFLAQAQSTLGTVRAFSVIGDVTLRNDSTGAEVALTTGREFTEGFSVITGENSSVVLVQSNGATLILEPETSLTVSEFLQDPFDTSSGTYSRLNEDPSTSQTRVRVNYGEVSGDVKRLRPTSSYNVDLPTGSAGIRGTKWKVTVFVDFNTGIVTATWFTAEGLVGFSYLGTTAEIPAGTQITSEGTLAEGSTLDSFQVVEVEVDDPENAPESTVAEVLSKVSEALANTQQEQDAPSESIPDEEDTEPEPEEPSGGSDPEIEGEAPAGDENTTVGEFSPGGEA